MNAYAMEETMSRTNDEWKDHVASELRKVSAEFQLGDTRMGKIEADLKTNTELTASLKTDTASLKADTEELLEVFHAMKGGLKVLGWLGNGLKWAVGIGAGIATILALFSGNTPKG